MQENTFSLRICITLQAKQNSFKTLLHPMTKHSSEAGEEKKRPACHHQEVLISRIVQGRTL